ncbi:MAG: sensor histidine kinase [Prevotellaceae bacterium]|nr:sensor histidine kinase [Prevotellaceae bacterium]
MKIFLLGFGNKLFLLILRILRISEKEHIFERFYQGNKKEGSSGLGLAIVSSICKQYDLDVQYSFRNAQHCFSVKKR